MKTGIEFLWLSCSLICLLMLAVFILEVLLFRWFLGLFGWHFGFWEVAGIIIVIDIVAAKFSEKRL